MSVRQRVRWGSIATLAMLPFAVQGQAAGPQFKWPTAAPSEFARTGQLTDRRLAEASGAALSQANPGLFWTVGDSGNPPELLAIDSTGALRGRFALQGVTNTDWEAVALGRCGGRVCVYIADTGDNGERRSEVLIHRVVEPLVSGDDPVRLRQVETLRLRYPSQSHDVEAMAVTPNGTVLLVTKGRSQGILLYQLEPEAWRRGTLVTATRSDSLPITPHSGSGRLVTGMAITPDGSRVVVRTYRDLFVFTRSPNGKLTPSHACDILGLEAQGEGVTWLPDGRLLLVSERGFFKQGAVNIVSCS